MSSIALADGDSWVYRCGFAAEKTYYLVEEPATEDTLSYRTFDNYKEAKAHADNLSASVIWSRKEIEPLENCLQMVKSSLENTFNVLGTKNYRLFISGKGNFRDDLFPDYKANRDGISKPKYYRDIRNYLVTVWGARVVDGMEADDAIGIAARELGSDAIIVAVDKDLDQIPGNHYNWVTGESYTVTPESGLRFFYEQVLSGDPTDNIPGIKGIGPAKATKALAACRRPGECAKVVWSMYQEAGLNDEILDRNATLLWIKRKHEDSHPLWKHLGRPSI